MAVYRGQHVVPHQLPPCRRRRCRCLPHPRRPAPLTLRPRRVSIRRRHCPPVSELSPRRRPVRGPGSVSRQIGTRVLRSVRPRLTNARVRRCVQTAQPLTSTLPLCIPPSSSHRDTTSTSKRRTVDYNGVFQGCAPPQANKMRSTIYAYKIEKKCISMMISAVSTRWFSYFGTLFHRFTDVSRKVTFPERRFLERRFPERRFPDSHFPGKTFPGKKTLCLNFIGKTNEGFFSYYKAKRENFGDWRICKADIGLLNNYLVISSECDWCTYDRLIA